MIEEILIQKVTDGRIQVVVYPERNFGKSGRTYYDPTESTCKRLEEMMRQHNAQPYIKKRGLSVWIAR